MALTEVRALTSSDVQALNGGTDRWLAEDRVTESEIEQIVGETDDVWYKPYEHRGAQEQFMRDYLTWEVALVEQIERDGFGCSDQNPITRQPCSSCDATSRHGSCSRSRT